jgi:hypothetical protein
MDVVQSPSIWMRDLSNYFTKLGVEMAGFNDGLLELGRIARGAEVSQSKKLMRAIKGIYLERSEVCIRSRSL